MISKHSRIIDKSNKEINNSIKSKKLKKCFSCNKYTLKNSCPKCNSNTESAHYKFIKIRDAPKDSSKYFLKIRKSR